MSTEEVYAERFEPKYDPTECAIESMINDLKSPMLHKIPRPGFSRRSQAEWFVFDHISDESNALAWLLHIAAANYDDEAEMGRLIKCWLDLNLEMIAKYHGDE